MAALTASERCGLKADEEHSVTVSGDWVVGWPHSSITHWALQEQYFRTSSTSQHRWPLVLSEFRTVCFCVKPPEK